MSSVELLSLPIRRDFLINTLFKLRFLQNLAFSMLLPYPDFPNRLLRMGLDTKNSRLKLWLIYFPRAAHHLFLRMFSEQPNLEQIEVMTHLVRTAGPTIQLSAHPSLQDAKDDCETLRNLQRDGWRNWLKNMHELERQGERVLSSHSVAFHLSPSIHHAFIHGGCNDTKTNASEEDPNSLSYWRLPLSGMPETDAPNNPTIFPTAFLRSHIPILLIRHPALAFPSTLRVASQFFGQTMGKDFMNIILRYRWHRIIYEWYEQDSRQPDGSPQPLVLDADDLMYNPAAIELLCRRTGLDVRQVKYEWDSMSGREMQIQYEGEAVFLDTLLGSEGIVQGKGSRGLRVEDESEEWKKEFGEERASVLGNMVEAAMGDYEFLKSQGLGLMN